MQVHNQNVLSAVISLISAHMPFLGLDSRILKDAQFDLSRQTGHQELR
jgi:hypothetical protein